MSKATYSTRGMSVADEISDARTILENTKPVPAGGTSSLDPERANFLAATNALETAETTAHAADQTAASLYEVRDAKEKAYLTARANLAHKVETTTGGDPAGIKAAGFGVAGDGATAAADDTGGAVTGFSVTLTRETGALDLSWDAKANGAGFMVEKRRVDAPPGQWTPVRFLTASRLRVRNLEPGQWVFRIQALFRGDREPGPWVESAAKGVA